MHQTAHEIAVALVAQLVRAECPDLDHCYSRSGYVAAGMTRAVAAMLDTMTAAEITTAAEDRAAWDRLLSRSYYGDEPAAHYAGLTALVLPYVITAATIQREAEDERAAARAAVVPASPGRQPKAKNFAAVLAARMAA